jgi:hypothetical protein
MSARCTTLARQSTFVAHWLAGGMLAVLVLLLAPRATAEETCVDCHRQQRDPRLREPTQELPTSVHGQAKLSCSDCHHGRPDEPTLRAHDVAKGFLARAAAGTPKAVCGGCHSDKQRMAEHDASVPTDQLELYRDSVHGKAFAAGNSRAATCAACHGAHDVKKVSDPQARVNRANVAGTCGHCHSDAELMTALKLPHDQEREWRHSVHGQKYAQWLSEHPSGQVVEGERHPPTCIDCHKDHGIGPRDTATAGYQGCHKDEWDSFASGPHEKAFKRMGFLPCVDCHGSHEITPVDATLIGSGSQTACRRCHAEGQKMFDKIRELGQTVRGAELVAGRARAALSGAPIGELAAKLQPIDEAQRALRVAVHTLDVDKIGAAAIELRTRAARVPPAPEVNVSTFERARSWAPGILFALGLLAVLVGLLVSGRGRDGGGKP